MQLNEEVINVYTGTRTALKHKLQQLLTYWQTDNSNFSICQRNNKTPKMWNYNFGNDNFRRRVLSVWWNPWAILIRIFLISSYLSDLKLDSTLSPLSLPPKMAKLWNLTADWRWKNTGEEVEKFVFWFTGLTCCKTGPLRLQNKISRYLFYLLESELSVSCFLVCFSRNNTSSFSRASPLRRNSASSLIE